MNRKLGLGLAFLIAAPVGAAFASQTIDFGPALPAGIVHNGYDGFNWYGAQNDVFADSSSSFFGSADINQFGRRRAFDLNSVDFLTLNSDAPSGGDTAEFTTVISSYLHGHLVKSVTENYGWGGAGFAGLNMDDVTRVTFSTTVTTTRYPSPGLYTSPDFTLIDALNVDKAAKITKAPEIDPAAAGGALTLLAGALLLLMGGCARRAVQA